jgi:hypothetical protein
MVGSTIASVPSYYLDPGPDALTWVKERSKLVADGEQSIMTLRPSPSSFCRHLMIDPLLMPSGFPDPAGAVPCAAVRNG